jgi:membrane protein DedA with SNARE-associated domain
LWNFALIGAGALLGEQWHVVGDYVGILQYIVIAAILCGIAYWAWRRFISPRLGRTTDEIAPSGDHHEDEHARGQ